MTTRRRSLRRIAVARQALAPITWAAGIAGTDAERRFVAVTPLGPAGQPEDVALPAVFLASDDARHITGETLFVSGGAGA